MHACSPCSPLLFSPQLVCDLTLEPVGVLLPHVVELVSYLRVNPHPQVVVHGLDCGRRALRWVFAQGRTVGTDEGEWALLGRASGSGEGVMSNAEGARSIAALLLGPWDGLGANSFQAAAFEEARSHCQTRVSSFPPFPQQAAFPQDCLTHLLCLLRWLNLHAPPVQHGGCGMEHLRQHPPSPMRPPYAIAPAPPQHTCQVIPCA